MSWILTWTRGSRFDLDGWATPDVLFHLRHTLAGHLVGIVGGTHRDFVLNTALTFQMLPAISKKIQEIHSELNYHAGKYTHVDLLKSQGINLYPWKHQLESFGNLKHWSEVSPYGIIFKGVYEFISGMETWYIKNIYKTFNKYICHKNYLYKNNNFYNFEIHKHYLYIIYFTKYIRIEKIILLHKLPYFKHTLIVHMFGVKNILMYLFIYLLWYFLKVSLHHARRGRIYLI